MAEKLDAFKFAGSNGGKYAQYMDGSVWKLTFGEDIPSESSGRSAPYQCAARRGLKLRSSVVEGALIIQAYKPESQL